jgi:endogenous inhibitor of DNA gyrase (YacG/DUF329 family)
MIDLDHWLSERYRVSTAIESQDKNSNAGKSKRHDNGESG